MAVYVGTNDIEREKKRLKEQVKFIWRKERRKKIGK